MFSDVSRGLRSLSAFPTPNACAHTGNKPGWQIKSCSGALIHPSWVLAPAEVRACVCACVYAWMDACMHACVCVYVCVYVCFYALWGLQGVMTPCKEKVRDMVRAMRLA